MLPPFYSEQKSYLICTLESCQDFQEGGGILGAEQMLFLSCTVNKALI